MCKYPPFPHEDWNISADGISKENMSKETKILKNAK
jgi:hypothetical protein